MKYNIHGGTIIHSANEAHDLEARCVRDQETAITCGFESFIVIMICTIATQCSCLCRRCHRKGKSLRMLQEEENKCGSEPDKECDFNFPH